MAQPFVGEIRVVGFNYAPPGWAQCNGQLLSVNDYTALFTLISTTYGGDGMQTFALPNLQSRVPIHTGTAAGGTYPLGVSGGAESVVLDATQLAGHTHPIAAQTAVGTQSTPSGGFFAASSISQFGPADAGVTTAPLLASTGGGQSHPNIQPFQCVNYIIALNGIYPPRN
jgi:microcystin-dependent protein